MALLRIQSQGRVLRHSSHSMLPDFAFKGGSCRCYSFRQEIHEDA